MLDCSLMLDLIFSFPGLLQTVTHWALFTPWWTALPQKFACITRGSLSITAGAGVEATRSTGFPSSQIRKNRGSMYCCAGVFHFWDVRMKEGYNYIEGWPVLMKALPQAFLRGCPPLCTSVPHASRRHVLSPRILSTLKALGGDLSSCFPLPCLPPA